MSSDCSLDPFEGIFSGLKAGLSAALKSSQVVYRFDGANVTRTTQLYTSLNCTGDNAVRVEQHGDFNLHKDQKTNDGGKAIDIDYHSILVTAVTDDGAKVSNATANVRREQLGQRFAKRRHFECFERQLPGCKPST